MNGITWTWPSTRISCPWKRGVRRVVVASSNHAADWYEHILRHRQLEMLSPDDKRLSDNWYGWAKASYELMGFMYATGSQGSELENVQIRIGAPRPIDGEKFRDDEAGYKRDLGAYISPRDLQQLFIKSIEAEDIEDAHGIPFQVFYGVSDNTRALLGARQRSGSHRLRARGRFGNRLCRGHPQASHRARPDRAVMS